jgi:hypothetical protein
MKRKTHIKEILEINDEYKKREKEFIDSLNYEIPENLYRLYPNGSFVRAVVKELVMIIKKENGGNFYLHYSHLKRKELDDYKNFINSIVFDKKNLRLSVVEKEETSTTSYNVLFDYKKDPYHKMFDDLESIKKEVSKIKEKELRETELLAKGYIKCERCGEVVKKEESISYKLISHHNFKNGYRFGVFCSRKCAMYEQFSLEG